jgi:hypothetical protein
MRGQVKHEVVYALVKSIGFGLGIFSGFFLIDGSFVYAGAFITLAFLSILTANTLFDPERKR